MEDHRELKLELSALLLSAESIIKYEPEYYQRELRSIFKYEYSIEEIKETLTKIEVLWEKVELSKHIEEIFVLPDDHFEGN